MDDGGTPLRVAAAWLRPWLQLRPYTGRVPFDLVFILVIGALHHTVLPSLLGDFMLIDLMTPWLVTTFVAAPLARAAALGLLGALILETHSAAPAGLYVSAYWVVLAVLRLTRATLSWRHAFPWIMTFLIAEAWVIAFETFVVSVSEGGFRFGFGYGAAQLVRLSLATAAGLLMSRAHRLAGVGEEAA